MSHINQDIFTQDVPCVCFCGEPCQCQKNERVLRHVAAGREYPALTQEQRDWCKEEITNIEGWDETQAEGEDRDVANAVLSAWVDYCRDKGLM